MQVGRYRITGELGRGAMGVVYRAEDPTIGRTVAIKTIRLTETASEQERKFLRDRLFREARAAGILSHPGIVTIYDIQEEGGICYVFMEYVDGPALEKIMAEPEPISRDLLLKVLVGTAESLDFAHSKGIVHRDIKPGNIMLTSKGDVKITDFGVAMFTSQQATSAGLLLGTPGYMSPEQISDRTITGRSDQFSLAVIAYQLLTGERPFAGMSLPSLMFKIVNEEPMAVPRLNPTLGNSVDVVLRKAMAKDPDARYPTCVAFSNALTTACGTRKDWQPMRLGAIQSLDTVSEPAEPTPVPSKPAPAASRPATVAPKPPAAAPTPPKPATPPPAQPPAASAGAATPPPATPDPGFSPSMTQRIEPTHTVRIARKPVPTADPALPPPTPPSRKWMGFVGGFVAIVLVGFLGRQLLFNNDAARKPPPVSEPSTTQPQPGPGEALKPSAVGPAVVKTEPPKPGNPVAAPDTTPGETKPVIRQKDDNRQPPAQGNDAVRVITNPAGAKVMFDGQPSQMCTSPCGVPLESGRHTLAAMAEGYRTQSRIFNLPQDREMVIMMERSTGTVMVRSTPAGATIFVDGQERPEKTPAILTLPTGHHKMEFAMEGMGRQVQEIDVNDGAVGKLDVRWGQ